MSEFPIETKLGGREEVITILKGAKYTEPEKTLYMWDRRGTVSSKGKVVLIDECLSRGVQWDMSDFKRSA